MVWIVMSGKGRKGIESYCRVLLFYLVNKINNSVYWIVKATFKNQVKGCWGKQNFIVIILILMWRMNYESYA